MALALFGGDVARVGAMPLPDYLMWQRYDSVEPLSVTAALDQLFARLLYMTAGDKKTVPADFMTFDRDDEARVRRGIERAQDAFMAIAAMDKKRKKEGV